MTTELVLFLLLLAMVLILTLLSWWRDQRVSRLERLIAGSPGVLEEHVHEWSTWKEWGVLYQQRSCKRCGFLQLEEQNTSRGKKR